jgi:hypothetical protein
MVMVQELLAVPFEREHGQVIRRLCELYATFVVFGLCSGCSTAGRADKADALAARLGYEGCRVSKPLTMGRRRAMA